MLVKRRQQWHRCRFGQFRWPYGHVDQRTRFQARGFLLVFCSNRVAVKRAVVELWTWDRRTDGRIAAFLNAPKRRAVAYKLVVKQSFTVRYYGTYPIGALSYTAPGYSEG